MLNGAHCFAAVTSRAMHLNDCISEGADPAQDLAHKFNLFVTQIPNGQPNLNKLGSDTTSQLVEFFEKRTDQYSVGIADHMLTAYNNR